MMNGTSQNFPASMFAGFGREQLVPTPSSYEANLWIKVEALERQLAQLTTTIERQTKMLAVLMPDKSDDI